MITNSLVMVHMTAILGDAEKDVLITTAMARAIMDVAAMPVFAIWTGIPTIALATARG